MPAVLKDQSATLTNEGDFFYFQPVAWANAAHIVNVYVTITSAPPNRLGQVPLLYMSQFDAFTVGGVTTQYTHSSTPVLFLGAALQVLRNNGSGVFAVYRRKNKINGPMDIRMRQINFSV